MKRSLAVSVSVILAAVLNSGVASAATGWAIQATPNPKGATETDLTGVSCPTTTDCTAVGYSTTKPTVYVGVAERWNGTSWALESIPQPAGTVDSFLLGVACSSATACTAVGRYSTSGVTASTLAERWNGTKWSIQPTPNPAGFQYGELLGVSCPTASWCTAVGDYANSAGTSVTLAERWTGASWKILPTPNPAGASGCCTGLSAVSCPTTSTCTAVGTAYNSSNAPIPLIELWKSTGWAVQSVPNPTGSSVLNGVSCPTAGVCDAVGDYTNSGGVGVTLVERWNGTTWTVQSTPNPVGSSDSVISAVRCRSVDACTAAGYFGPDASGNVDTLVESWNGTHWTIASTPNPTGATTSELFGVACPSTTECTAVGARYSGSTSVESALAEHE